MRPMAERTEADKASHREVKYEEKSSHLFERCGNCVMFIRPNRCEIVETPIRSAGWCIRWEKKHG